MADRRGDGMRQQPPYSSGHQERVFDGGGGGGPAFGNDYDPGSSYMSLLGSGVNPQQSLQPPQAWGVDEVAPPTINLTPQFSMVSKDRRLTSLLIWVLVWSRRCKSMQWRGFCVKPSSRC